MDNFKNNSIMLRIITENTNYIKTNRNNDTNITSE